MGEGGTAFSRTPLAKTRAPQGPSDCPNGAGGAPPGRCTLKGSSQPHTTCCGLSALRPRGEGGMTAQTEQFWRGGGLTDEGGQKATPPQKTPICATRSSKSCPEMQQAKRGCLPTQRGGPLAPSDRSQERLVQASGWNDAPKQGVRPRTQTLKDWRGETGLLRKLQTRCCSTPSQKAGRNQSRAALETSKPPLQRTPCASINHRGIGGRRSEVIRHRALRVGGAQPSRLDKRRWLGPNMGAAQPLPQCSGGTAQDVQPVISAGIGNQTATPAMLPSRVRAALNNKGRAPAANCSTRAQGPWPRPCAEARSPNPHTQW